MNGKKMLSKDGKKSHANTTKNKRDSRKKTSVVKRVLTRISIPLIILNMFILGIIIGQYILIEQQERIYQDAVEYVFELDDYTFTYASYCQVAGYHPEKCIGWTNEKHDIFVVQGLTLQQTIDTCNHEICHNIIDEEYEIEEYLCDNIEMHLNHPACRQLRIILLTDFGEMLKYANDSWDIDDLVFIVNDTEMNAISRGMYSYRRVGERYNGS